MSRPAIILGIGSGRCGTRSLATLLNQQPGTRVTHEAPPRLPWRIERPGKMAQRLAQMQRSRTATIVGDVASYHLPYVEEVLGYAPDVRIVCLKRPRAEVIDSFCRWIDKVHPLPTNHWAARPATGWHHDPIWTRIFPQYDIQDREQGIGRYWDEYYQRAEALEAQFPNNVRVVDWLQALGTEPGQRNLLSFCGYAADRQVVSLEVHENKRETAPDRRAPGQHASDPDDPLRCVVLVPHLGQIVGPCESALKELERRGYSVRRLPVHAAIDAARNQMATIALCEGFEETLWIDAAMVFDPDHVDRLRAHHLPVACALYPKKGSQVLAGQPPQDASRQTLRGENALLELRYASAGLLHVRREVYERMQCDLALPVCDEATSRYAVPFFQPLVLDEAEGPTYLPDDWSFCERARECGFRIIADTSIQILHCSMTRSDSDSAGKKPPPIANFAVSVAGADANSTAGSAAKPVLAGSNVKSRSLELNLKPRRLEIETATETSPSLSPSTAVALEEPPPQEAPYTDSPFTPCPTSQCAILVPVADHIEPACESALRELERRGYPVWRVHGYKQVDLARCQMASDALAAGCRETLWIDADTAFHPDMVDRLRSHDLPIVCGIYPKKSKRELAIHALPGTEHILFGKQGGPLEILYAPTGFLLVRREVYDKIREQLDLPLCRADTGRTLVPYYAPLIRADGDGWWYLAEDFSFCERARQCGYKIMADSSIRLLHIGKYAYGWEDAGRQVQRFPNFKFHLTDAQPKKK